MSIIKNMFGLDRVYVPTSQAIVHNLTTLQYNHGEHMFLKNWVILPCWCYQKCARDAMSKVVASNTQNLGMDTIGRTNWQHLVYPTRFADLGPYHVRVGKWAVKNW